MLLDPLESNGPRAASILHDRPAMRHSAENRRIRTHTVVLALLLAACVSTQVEADVEVSWDESVSFAYLRKFAWVEGTPPEDETLQRRIEAAIQRELIVKGFRKDSEDPDFHITTHFEGESVTVEMLDLDTGEVFWRGVGTGAVPEKEKKLEYRINKAAAKMFKKFPPKSK